MDTELITDEMLFNKLMQCDIPNQLVISNRIQKKVETSWIGIFDYIFQEEL